MSLEQEACSLIQSKELKAIGIFQRSLYTWAEYNPRKIANTGHNEESLSHGFCSSYLKGKDSHYSAFSCSELGPLVPSEWMPVYISHLGKWECRCDNSLWAIEAVARAHTLLWLIRNRHISLETVNSKIL